MSNLDEKFDRLRESFVEVKVDVAELKGDVKHMNGKFDEHIQIIKEHVAGDNKILSYLEPILPQLASMAEDHKYRKEKKKRREEFLRSWKLKLTFVLTVSSFAALVYGFVR